MSKEVTVGGRVLSKEEKQHLYLCISARLGFIETGEVSLRASDAINAGQQKKVKALSLEQKKLTVMLEELMYELL